MKESTSHKSSVIDAKTNLIPRTQERELRRKVEERPCILVTGARQTGKTTLLRSSFPGIEYVSFDSILQAASASESPEAFLQRFTKPVIFDEIQYASPLFRALKASIDADRDMKGRYLLTGSQTFELMKGVSDSLAGRIGIMRLETLSAREIADSGRFDREALLQTPFRGGYPELWRSPDIDAGSWFEDYIRTYIERDLKELVQVRDLVEFRRFLSAAANRAGQLVNFTDLGRSCGVSPNTAKAWTAALETSGIMYVLPPWFTNAETRLIKSPKLYFADTGLLCALLNIEHAEDFEKSSSSGAIWENFVFMELVKTGGWIPGRTLFFYRDHSGNEVDFVGISGDRRILVEAKFSQRIRPERLGFSATSLAGVDAASFEEAKKNKPACFVAAPTADAAFLSMKDFTLYDPRMGSVPT